MHAPTDRDLILRARRGDAEAYGELVTHYQAGVFNVCYRMTNERREAEDLAQVNGKVRDRVIVAAEATEEEVKSAALASEVIRKYLEGKEPRKVIVVKGKLVSVVV